MNTATKIITALAVIVASYSLARAVSNDTKAVDHVAYSRSCIFPEDGAASVSVSAAAAAYTAQLDPHQRYAIQCHTPTHWNTSTAASGHDATSSHFLLLKDAMLEITTTTTIRYVSLLGTATSTCVVIQCQ